jgi:hypothetical protein
MKDQLITNQTTELELSPKNAIFSVQSLGRIR